MNDSHKDTKYLQFPLCLMQNFFNDPAGTIQKIFDAGIYRFSQKVPNDQEAAARQLLYDYYRHKNKLTSYLHRELSSNYNNGTLELDEDYNGFVGPSGTFEPLEHDDLVKIMNDDACFNEAVIEYYQVDSALKFLDIESNTGYKVTAGKELLKNIPAGHPWPMISKDILFRYYTHDKQPWELEQFAAYIAVGSIIGKQTYCRTNKQFILSRMLGFVKYKDIPEKPNPIVSDLIKKYSTRYWMDKLLQQLELNWEIKIYNNNMHGLWIGNSKISIEALVLAAETKKQANRIEKLKQQKIEAKNKALQQLNKRQQLK